MTYVHLTDGTVIRTEWNPSDGEDGALAEVNGWVGMRDYDREGRNVYVPLQQIVYISVTT